MAVFLSIPATFCMASYGYIPQGLGCWTWTIIAGWQGLCTYIINAYHPTPDTSATASTVFSQHEVALQSNSITHNTGKVFLEDLQCYICQCLDAGNQVIVGMGTNNFTQSGKLLTWSS